MPLAALFAFDVISIGLLTFAIYYPRHRRKDMLVACLGINVAVLGVTQALASAEISAGLGLGLFGVLSIIRLRSAEMDQEEVAYYFASLAIGLLGGFPVSPAWLSPALMAAIVATILVADHPRVFNRYRSQVIALDHAYTNEAELRRRLEAMLDAQVHSITVRKIDFVHDTTSAEVRYRPLGNGAWTGSAYASEFEINR